LDGVPGCSSRRWEDDDDEEGWYDEKTEEGDDDGLAGGVDATESLPPYS
jgi:hypothetical protein